MIISDYALRLFELGCGMTEDEIYSLSASGAAKAIAQLPDADAARIAAKFLIRSGFPQREMLGLIQGEAGRPVTYWSQVIEYVRTGEPPKATGETVPSPQPGHHPADYPVLDNDTPAMKMCGVVLIALATILGFWAVAFDISVPSSSEYGSPSRIINTGLLADRTLLASCSGTLFLSGIILFAAGQLEKVIRSVRR